MCIEANIPFSFFFEHEQQCVPFERRAPRFMLKCVVVTQAIPCHDLVGVVGGVGGVALVPIGSPSDGAWRPCPRSGRCLWSARNGVNSPRILVLDVLDGTSTFDRTDGETSSIGETADSSSLPLERALNLLVSSARRVEVENLDPAIGSSDNKKLIAGVHGVNAFLEPVTIMGEPLGSGSAASKIEHHALVVGACAKDLSSILRLGQLLLDCAEVRCSVPWTSKPCCPMMRLRDGQRRSDVVGDAALGGSGRTLFRLRYSGIGRDVFENRRPVSMKRDTRPMRGRIEDARLTEDEAQAS
ncbi:hypothetical protein KCU83_g640, partial [Aureobasidium melanogenum]